MIELNDEIVGKIGDSIDKFGSLLSDTFDKYSGPAADFAIMMLRIDALGSVLGTLVTVMLAIYI